jgi:hypothetical protein
MGFIILVRAARSGNNNFMDEISDASLHYVMGISATGEGLDIVISTACSIHHDWQAFAAWYSIYTNLPDARVSILCARDFTNGRIPSFGYDTTNTDIAEHENRID